MSLMKFRQQAISAICSAIRWNWVKCACLMGCQLIGVSMPVFAEPLRFKSAEATFHGGDEPEFATVIDGVEFGPQGWSTAPRAFEPQSLVVRCANPVQANELDVTLFFLAGRPSNAMAEFSLSYTTDPTPSLQGNWQALEISRFSSDVHTLRRTDHGRLHMDFFEVQVTGNEADDVYRLTAKLPGGRATGFRLDAFPVEHPQTKQQVLSWWKPYDFTLTEFRVAVHERETTNIALYQPVTSSYPTYTPPNGMLQRAANLTDGLPGTIVQPNNPALGAAFYYEIDLGRVATIDHIGLRNRGDFKLDRASRVRLRLFDQQPANDLVPTWEGMIREDGSHPAPGAVDLVHANDGKGKFCGRHLRISSESTVPYSPQFAEVEVYETRTPEVVSVLADGRPLDWKDGAGGLDIPPGVRRLALELRIPQVGMPMDDAFRWRLPGEVDDWQNSRLMTLQMSCPKPGKITFEAQARHSDGQWDGSICQLPMVVRQHFWEHPGFQILAVAAALIAAVLFSRRLLQRRTARHLAAANARTALAEERSRIARDLHDDLGANLAEIAMISELARESLPCEHPTRAPLDKIFDRAESNARRLGEIVWAVNPANDTLEHFTKYLCKLAQDYLSAADIRCRFDLPETLPAGSFSAAQRYHLLLAAKEAIHNAVRHGNPSTVTLRLSANSGSFVISIHDDGCGCDAQATAASPRGCANMRLRMETIGGNFLLTSVPGQGTTVVLTTPFSS